MEKTIKLELPVSVADSLVIEVLKDQYRGVLKEIDALLQKESLKPHNVEDLLNHRTTALALEEVLRYNMSPDVLAEFLRSLGRKPKL
jgi:hypothetical protein